MRAGLIKLTGVTKRYKSGEWDVRALDDVSLRIYAREFVAIVGDSGSGKSTLMNMLGCLDMPTLGSYRLDGETVSELSDGALSAIRNQKIGFIFHCFDREITFHRSNAVGYAGFRNKCSGNCLLYHDCFYGKPWDEV